MMKRSALGAAATLLVLTSGAEARQDRSVLIERARAMADESAAIEVLLSAMDATLGPPDSLWAVAGYDMAQVLIQLDRAPLVTLWLRFIARHGAAWPIDPTWYPPGLVQAWQAIRATVMPDDVPTAWQWPGRFNASAPGTIQARHSDGRTTTTHVAGQRENAADVLSLPPGTYDVVVSADGYEPLTLTREVLPGVATRIGVDLIPLLPEAARAAAVAALLRVSWIQEGTQRCTNGFVASDDGLVLTRIEREAGLTAGLQITRSDGGRLGPASIAAVDPDRGLTVLRLDSVPGPSLTAAPATTESQYAWTVHFDGCDASSTARTRVTTPGPATALLSLAPPVPAAATGAPIVNRDGLLLGIVETPTTGIEYAEARLLLERARQRTVAIQIRPPGRRFPWMWAGGGVAAAALGIVLFGGGGGADNGGVPPPPTTGGIIITFPN